MQLPFRDIEIDDVKIYMEHWTQTDQRASDYSFPILWGWSEGAYGYQAA